MERGERERSAENFEYFCSIFPLLSHILLILKFQSSHCAEWPAEKRASKPDSQILFSSIRYIRCELITHEIYRPKLIFERDNYYAEYFS